MLITGRIADSVQRAASLTNGNVVVDRGMQHSLRRERRPGSGADFVRQNRPNDSFDWADKSQLRQDARESVDSIVSFIDNRLRELIRSLDTAVDFMSMNRDLNWRVKRQFYTVATDLNDCDRNIRPNDNPFVKFACENQHAVTFRVMPSEPVSLVRCYADCHARDRNMAADVVTSKRFVRTLPNENAKRIPACWTDSASGGRGRLCSHFCVTSPLQSQEKCTQRRRRPFVTPFIHWFAGHYRQRSTD